MSHPVLMPKQGNTVESCVLLSWHKQKGERVEKGELLCEVETDKAVMEVESPAAGVILATFFEAGDEVPVLTNIAVIGEPGEETARYRPQSGNGTAEGRLAQTQTTEPASAPSQDSPALAASDGQEPRGQPSPPDGKILISPRAQNLAAETGVGLAGLQGSGPGGRIVARDVRAALEHQKPLSPLAQAMLAKGDFEAPQEGSGIRGRIMSKDLRPLSPRSESAGDSPPPDGAPRAIPIKGARKLIAERMLSSLQSTAQLTLSSSADARAILAYRKRLKQSGAQLSLTQVTINDLIMFVVARTLLSFPRLNALFKGQTIYEYGPVHLGMAVDTPRGLIVPVIRQAHVLSLSQISAESRRLSQACIDGKIDPDELQGGTFTVTNLGALGIENFTPILNPPQVGILGVGNINLKPVELDGDVAFIPHLALSLTVNHQVVDGAPAARFLKALGAGLADLELILAT